MPGIRQTKLFSVEMGKEAFCDCGKQADMQFVVAENKSAAKSSIKLNKLNFAILLFTICGLFMYLIFI